MKNLTSHLLLFLLPLLVVACQKEGKNYYHVEGTVFHTYYSIKYESEQPRDEEIAAVYSHIDSVANPFNPHSLLYAINNNLPQYSDSSLLYLFGKATEVSRATGGHYDITVGPLVNAWGFGYEPSPYEGGVPQTVIDSLRQFVGYEKVKVVADTLQKEDSRTSIDMASIAKGYTSDMVAEALRAKGVENYMVEIGGEIAYCGKNPQHKPWTIGVNVPTLDKLGSKNGELEAILSLEGKGGVATSGNYRNYKINEEGVLFAHTIDPIEGIPVQRDVLSATILAPDCATADALATACMLVGSEQAMALIKKWSKVECLLLVADKESPKGYRQMMSEGMKKYLSNP